MRTAFAGDRFAKNESSDGPDDMLALDDQASSVTPHSLLQFARQAIVRSCGREVVLDCAKLHGGRSRAFAALLGS